ncbi:hypothetical protein ACHAXH_008255 [Discostella pseudostelligera]
MANNEMNGAHREKQAEEKRKRQLDDKCMSLPPRPGAPMRLSLSPSPDYAADNIDDRPISSRVMRIASDKIPSERDKLDKHGEGRSQQTNFAEGIIGHTNTAVTKSPHGRFLIDLLHLEQTLDSSVLPRKKSEMQTATTNNIVKNDPKSLIDPLDIPSSWKRSDYARRTLPELENHIIHTSSGREECNAYALFTVLYNQCSLSAIANWSMLDCPIQNISSTTADENSSLWKKFKKKHKKMNANRMMRLEFPQPMFRMCGVCEGFGHYEVECELLQTGGGYHHQNNSRNLQYNGLGKKRKAHELSARGINLDDSEKRQVISKLAKEIDTQKTRFPALGDTIVDNHVDEGEVLPTSTNSESQPSNTTQDDQHKRKQPCCMICFNRITIDGGFIACNGCDGLFHLKCLYPPLSSKPEGNWFCNSCQSPDDDASSVTVIEGCGEIEQFSSRFKNKRNSRIASSLSEEDPAAKDESYLTKHLERQHGHLSGDFFVGEICWVERFNDQLNIEEWWPAKITDCGGNTAHTVKFFALDEVGVDKSENEIRQYLYYFEELGYKSFFTRGDVTNHETFRQALIESVSRLGLKSLGQALQLARCRQSQHHISTTSAGLEDAEIDKIDGIVIMATRNGDTSHDCNGLSGKLRMVAQFTINEIVGSIVSWQAKLLDSRSTICGGGGLNVHYGVVLSINDVTGAVLVRTIPSLCDGSALHDDNANEYPLVVAADDVGPSLWIPINHIRFVCNTVDSSSWEGNSP